MLNGKKEKEMSKRYWLFVAMSGLILCGLHNYFYADSEKNFGEKLGEATAKGFVQTISQFLAPAKKKPILSEEVQIHSTFIQDIFAGKKSPIPPDNINLVQTTKLNKVVFNTTALMAAVIAGKNDVITYLLDNGANPNVRNINGITALHLAAREGKKDIVKQLLDRDADPNNADDNRMTPLLYAVMRKQDYFNDTKKQDYFDVIKLLLEHGANPNLVNNQSMSPLMMAALNNDYPVVDFLLEYRADPDKKNAQGKIAFDLTFDKKIKNRLLEATNLFFIPSDNGEQGEWLVPSFGW